MDQDIKALFARAPYNMFSRQSPTNQLNAITFKNPSFVGESQPAKKEKAAAYFEKSSSRHQRSSD